MSAITVSHGSFIYENFKYVHVYRYILFVVLKFRPT